MSGIERRFVAYGDDDTRAPLSIEVRKAEGGQDQNWLVGYAAVFDSDSVQMDDFIERIDKNAFHVVAERRGRKTHAGTTAFADCPCTDPA
jgi:phage head maturation protease